MSELTDDLLFEDPMEWFEHWYGDALAGRYDYPNAMTLSTVAEDGQPSCRVVLLKDYSREGFVFYTNYKSAKAKQIDANPSVALVFYWHGMAYQIRVEGIASKVSEQRSDEYFASRPRGSQLSAWASKQSAELSGEAETLEQRLDKFAERFEGRDVERPPWWGGYIVSPRRFEFWKAGNNRVHTRWLFEREHEDRWDWSKSKLYP